MKIRTRLLLSLLPSFMIGLTLILALLCFSPPVSLLIAGLLLCILSAALSLFLMAGKITRTIKKLNGSALDIAAGQYGASIQLQGPQELGELANTLNTMSECLLEHINSLKDSALLQEKADGDAACARLLQQHLLQKSIDECRWDAIALKAISFPSDSPKGFFLRYPRQQKEAEFALHLLEAKEEGIEGMYELLKETPGRALSLFFDGQASLLRTKANSFPLPLFWSYAEEKLSLLKSGPERIQPGDFVFLMNPAFYHFFKSPTRLFTLIEKVLRVFGEEGLETCAAMLQKEISFLAKRRVLEDDLHLICIQILT